MGFEIDELFFHLKNVVSESRISTKPEFLKVLSCYTISVFCYDNKNNNDNSNKTWSLKLLSVIIL